MHTQHLLGSLGTSWSPPTPGLSGCGGEVGNQEEDQRQGDHLEHRLTERQINNKNDKSRRIASQEERSGWEETARDRDWSWEVRLRQGCSVVWAWDSPVRR